MNLRFFAAMSIALMGSSLSTWAYTETDSKSDTNSAAFDSNILTNDLLESIVPVGTYTITAGGHTAGQSVTAGDNGFALSGINDGFATDTVSSTSGTTLFANGQLGSGLAASPQLTFQLDTVTNPGGYSLSSLNSISGFNGYSAELADQTYTFAYSTVADPSTFITVGTVNYDPYVGIGADPGGATGSQDTSTQVTLSSLGLSGVSAIRLTFNISPAGTGIQQGNLIREIDLVGSPTTVPEPSTWALVSLMLAALIVPGWVRARRAC